MAYSSFGAYWNENQMQATCADCLAHFGCLLTDDKCKKQPAQLSGAFWLPFAVDKRSEKQPAQIVWLISVAFWRMINAKKQPGRSILTFSVALGAIHVQTPLFQICPGIYVIHRSGVADHNMLLFHYFTKLGSKHILPLSISSTFRSKLSQDKQPLAIVHNFQPLSLFYKALCCSLYILISITF